MGKGISEESRYRSVIGSEVFKQQVKEIFDYGFQTFSYNQAVRYRFLIRKYLGLLSTCYLMFPACLYLFTKDRRYRNVLLPSHRIIYRITSRQIQILTILHFSSSVSTIRRARRIKV